MSKKVLVVEDSPTEALRARIVLEQEGYQVTLANDGKQCLYKAAEERPDLIVLDTIMPRMSGYEAYNRLKVDPITSEIPILMLLTENGAINKPKKMGADTCIAKPYTPPLLIEGVKTAIRNKSDHNERFMSLISHEFRTPLHGIVGMTDLVLNTPLTAEQKDYLGQARKAANTLMSMISDVLEFSELEAGQLSLEKSSFNLQTVVDETYKIISSRAQEKGLEFSCNIAAQVPHYLEGDPRRLRQVFTILLDNAIKFTDHGRVTLSIAAKAQEGDHSQLHFSVRDTGIGIPTDKQQIIFQAFQQADNSNTRQYGGIGLGLRVAQHLVELMGGQITVQSDGEPGSGSTFEFSILFKHSEHIPDPLPEPTREETLKLRILVAEDSPTNQLIARANLNKAGHTVRIAANGKLAVQALAEEAFDLILMDVAMPEMDGLDATRKIRQQEQETGQHIPIIAMTAFAMKGYREKCMEAGMDGYVSKPVSAIELHKTIEPFLTQKQCESDKGIPSEPPINLKKALEVVDEDMDILEMVVEMFLNEYSMLVDVLNQTLKENDIPGVEASAHKLKGVLGNVGSGPAHQLCDRLERMGVDGNLAGGMEIFEDLKKEIERVVVFYSQSDWIKDAARMLGDS